MKTTAGVIGEQYNAVEYGLHGVHSRAVSGIIMKKIYNGDCLKILDELAKEGKRVDAIITDPPFFMPATHYQSRVNWPKSWADTTILSSWWGQVVNKSLSVLDPGGHFLAFCNGESYPVFYPVMFPLFDKLKCLVWGKGRVGLGRIWRNQHELVIAGRNNNHKFIQDGQLRADVFQFKATPSRDRQHPVEKPTDMLQWLIESVTEEGDTVLDLFMGGGSTGVAAEKSGRSFIGIEMDKKYYEAAIERFNNETRQVALI